MNPIRGEEENYGTLWGEEDDLFPLQKPNKEVINEQCLAFNHSWIKHDSGRGSEYAPMPGWPVMMTPCLLSAAIARSQTVLNIVT